MEKQIFEGEEAKQVLRLAKQSTDRSEVHAEVTQAGENLWLNYGEPRRPDKWTNNVPLHKFVDSLNDVKQEIRG